MRTQGNPKEEVITMVAHEYFQPRLIDEPATSSPTGPTSPPPKRRFRGRLAAGVVILALAGGAGSGALTSTLLGKSGSTATSTRTSSGTATVSTASSSTQTGSNAVGVYAAVSPGVVTITASVGGPFGSRGQATGSGIVLDGKGDILTNDHVVSGAQQVTVTFSDGSTASGTVIGTNSGYDLAVVRASASASKLHPVTLGNSSSVQVGDTVYAIGSPFGLSGTLTEGIVSGTNRSSSSITSSSSIGSSLSNLIQTDTAINPGNSGGPLVNTQGQVIGINQSIESPVDGNVGVGFAIPSNQVTQLLSSLEGGSNL
ncbi:MAG TPA: trypsin-like peptidase domain-containing protein [Candidatus Dormibacteraeota bacterium]|jgi:putative serine protease PepD|nr:trypsin-like peptidase domain-containing protein [Candidatus Dormibacteraeota bacterium]